ncbi:MAG: hypothetical protein DMG07_02535, partial [Acidobacteria bacterium]
MGVAFLFMAGSALAGTTAIGSAVTYAREVGAANAVYTLPTKSVTRSMAVIRDATQDFFVDVTLGAGAVFTAGGLPEASDLALTSVSGAGGGAIAAPTIISGGTAGSTSVTYSVDITTSFTGLPFFTLDVTAWAFRVVANTLGAAAGPIPITIATRDAATGSAIDVGADTVFLATSVYGVVPGDALVSTTATVDVATSRLQFLATFGDTTRVDNGASIGIKGGSNSSIRDLTGATYFTTGADSINLVITGNLSGITAITWTGGATRTVNPTSADVTAGSTTLSIPGSDTNIGG